MSQAANVAEILRERRHVLLLNHVSPDGDCLGSTLALARALWARGQQATVGSSDGVPDVYRFLPDSDRVVQALAAGESFDAVVYMECSTPERAGDLAGRAAGIPLVINIDHHLSNSGFGDIVLLDVDAAAVAEIVFPIVADLQPVLDPDTAACLLTALVTDTGSFRYTNVRPRSFDVAAALVRAGARPATVFSEVYENRSAGSVRLLGMALSRMAMSEAGRIAWTAVTQAMLRDSGTSMEESEGIVGALRAIRGVRVAALFKEEPDGIRVSLRGAGSVRANVIAEAFGGGGHAAAAGFTAVGPLEEVVQRTLAEIRRELGAAAR
jgi:bifunctional oligoribonuclease and PAP phosphatase NrnA